MNEQVRRARTFAQIDVFTDEAYRGNPLAVVVDGSDLTTEQMQQFANWTNLSETTFLLPPTDPAADYLVRIFTPVTELPFAGHPTLGSCRVWLDSGGTARDRDVIVQQCAAGLIPIRRDGSRLALRPPSRNWSACSGANRFMSSSPAPAAARPTRRPSAST